MYDYSGNVINPVWFSTITNGKGGADLISINLLADIIYWHTPTIKRDEQTGMVISKKKKFKADKLQKSYGHYATLYGVSKKTIKRSFDKLESLGLVFREFRNISVDGTLLSNVMFLSIDKLAIEDISSTPMDKKGGRWGQKEGGGGDKNDPTYTENTTETTTKTTPTINSREDKSSDEQRTQVKNLKDFDSSNQEEGIKEYSPTNNVDSKLKNSKPEKIYGDEEIRKIVARIKQKKEELGLLHYVKDNRGIQNFNSGKFKKEILEPSGCNNVLELIDKLLETNAKRGQYAYNVSTPQLLYRKTPDIMAKAMQNGERFKEEYVYPDRAEEYISTKEGKNMFKGLLELAKENGRTIDADSFDEFYDVIVDFLKNIFKITEVDGEKMGPIWLEKFGNYFKGKVEKRELIHTFKTSINMYAEGISKPFPSK